MVKRNRQGRYNLIFFSCILLISLFWVSIGNSQLIVTEDVIKDGQYDVNLYLTGLKVDSYGRLSQASLVWMSDYTLNLCQDKSFRDCSMLDYTDLLARLRKHKGRPKAFFPNGKEEPPLRILVTKITEDSDPLAKAWLQFLSQQDFVKPLMKKNVEHFLEIDADHPIPATVYWQFKKDDEIFFILEMPRK